MEGDNVDRAKRIAYSGMVAALVIVSLYIGLLIRARVTFLALATYMLAIPVIVSNISTGILVAFATDLLTFLLIPDKMYALLFVPMSFYPVIKALIESKTKLHWVFKFLYFDLSLLAVYLISKFLIFDQVVIKYFALVVIGTQAFFYVYDIIFTKFIGWLVNRFEL